MTTRMATQYVKSSWLERWTPEKVVAADDPADAWMAYARQEIGIPIPSRKDASAVRARAQTFFDQYPRADWYSMCRIVQWAKAKKRRPSRMLYLVEDYRKAWSAGYLPELDPVGRDQEVDEAIDRALQVEERESWRRRLIGVQGSDARRRAYEEWERSR